MKKLPDESIDLIIADPPYNLGKNFGNAKVWNNFKEWLEWSKIWINECKRVLKNTGAIFIFGIHHYLCFIQVYLYEIGMKYRRQIIWHYENAFSTYKKGPRALYEPILWFSKTDDFVYNKIYEPYKSTERLKYKITKNGRVWTPNPEGRHGGDIWKIPTLAGRRFREEKVDHPTQKPIKLARKIVRHFSNQNDLVLIPFAGSGTECLACRMENRKFIGVELNPKYVKVARNRLETVLF
ncbi:MAG: DNA-methyltransferase [Candidatus Heimdallarchaeaceae archaeon]